MKNRIKEIRKEKKITQQELVDGLDITRQYISLIEKNGESEPPSLKVANSIDTKLGVCIYQVFDLDGKETYKCQYCNCN
ncbi:helix-turn-helix transcriptional regulator [Peptostreptococcus sp. D1]|uniref:helix-turn-helix transcriptional regulator n=1 Tax=Peptostreptococcus sp. D1 TaxID=72304 RepID=UPI0008E118F1|nr:helix-turn-helix domain-containing protein [Peptostreptococcus sp. D1]SFE64059.1 putative transcriptional regulator [Peptostreptococcus sp. D1]